MANVAADYFSTGVFANCAPGELFAHHTCNVCGTRLKTWEAFKAHRKANDCRPLAVKTPDRKPRRNAESEVA